MRSFFHSVRFKVLVGIAALLLTGMIIAAASHGAFSPASSALGVAFSPVQRFSAYISSKAGEISDNFKSGNKYKKENADLKKQVENLQKEVVDYNKIKKENSLYEEFLGVKESNPDFVFEPATVIARDSSSLYYSFTIDKGSLDKIKVNDPVILGKYLVGVVAKVMPTYSVVETVLDPRVNVSAYETRTRESGFVTTDTGLSSQGLCRLSNLTKTTAVASGGIVCTSGIGGVYPRDLIIGTVTDIKYDTHDISTYAVVKPGADISDLTDVFIITSFKGQGISDNS